MLTSSPLKSASYSVCLPTEALSPVGRGCGLVRSQIADEQTRVPAPIGDIPQSAETISPGAGQTKQLGGEAKGKAKDALNKVAKPSLAKRRLAWQDR